MRHRRPRGTHSLRSEKNSPPRLGVNTTRDGRLQQAATVLRKGVPERRRYWVRSTRHRFCFLFLFWSHLLSLHCVLQLPPSPFVPDNSDQPFGCMADTPAPLACYRAWVRCSHEKGSAFPSLADSSRTAHTHAHRRFLRCQCLHKKSSFGGSSSRDRPFQRTKSSPLHWSSIVDAGVGGCGGVASFYTQLYYVLQTRLNSSPT